MDPYAVLGLAQGAPPRAVRKAYCVAALKYHPDKNPGGAAKFREATQAYTLITSGGHTEAGAGAQAASGRAGADRRRDRGEDETPQPAPPPPSQRGSEPRREPRPRPWYEQPGPAQPWPAQPWSWPLPAQSTEYQPSWRAHANHAGSWARVPPEVLGQMIEALFYEEFGVRWSDLPEEAREVLLRANGYGTW